MITKDKIGTASSAVEVLEQMLDFWGPEGEHWCVGLGYGTLQMILGSERATGCIWGAVGGLKHGKVMYPEFGTGDTRRTKLGKDPYADAITAIELEIGKRYPKYVYTSIEGRKYGHIVQFNDTIMFYNKLKTKKAGFKLIKEVVCGAMKTLMEEEDARDAGNAGAGNGNNQHNNSTK